MIMKAEHRGRCLLLVMFSLVWGANCLMAQVNRASIVGTVTDRSGGVVPDAEVVLVENATGTTQTTRTDQSGYYAFPSLNYGGYTITVTHTGFKTYKRMGIQLVQGAGARVNVTLEVGATTQQVTVTGAASMLETRNTATNYVEDTKTLMQLPLMVNGAKRDPTQWEVTMPGYQGGAGFETVFNGSVGLYGEQLVDGAPSECNPAALGGCLRASFSAEIVSEMKVSTNVNAESGFTAGQVTSIVTKSGTNQLHGSAYEYMRNDSFDARDFFSPTVPIDKQNEFGFTVGGPRRLFKLTSGLCSMTVVRLACTIFYSVSTGRPGIGIEL
jgi:Carboxypeptidase regulatory-like domain